MIKKIFKKEKYIIIGALLLLIMNELMEVGVVIFDRRLIDAALTGSIDGIWSAAGLCVLAGVISITVFVISDITNAVCVNRIGLYLRSNLFDSIFRHGRKTVSEFDTADLISRMTNDVKQFTGNCVSFAYYLIMGVLSLIGSAVLMFYYQPIVALIAIALAATMLIIPKLCAKKVEALSETQSEGASKFTESIQNIFEGLEVVFNYNLKDKMKNSFERENKELTAKSQRLDVLKSFMNMVGQSFSCVGNVLLLIASAYFVYEGKMTVGALAVFITLNSSFTSATQMIIQFYPIVIGIAISIKRST
ncbi:MAG: ABC transporter ATP-binding protein [Lachnospiraceae bacterium]|nr:ABC transporter ATP-binding protein [Lachnospiraceae bacterium]